MAKDVGMYLAWILYWPNDHLTFVLLIYDLSLIYLFNARL